MLALNKTGANRTAIKATARILDIDNRRMAFPDEEIRTNGPERAVFASWRGHIPHTNEQVRRIFARACDLDHILRIQAHDAGALPA
jgi:hypothetical protein